MNNYFLKLFIVSAVIAAFAASCGSSAEVEAATVTQSSAGASLGLNAKVPQAATQGELAALDDAKKEALLARSLIEELGVPDEFLVDWQKAESRFNKVKSRSLPTMVDEVKEVAEAYAEAAALYRNLIQNIVLKYQDEINAKRSLLVEIGIPPEHKEEWEQTELKFTGYIPSSSAATMDEIIEEVAFYAETAAEYDNWFERIYPYASISIDLAARARWAFRNLRETTDATGNASDATIRSTIDEAVAANASTGGDYQGTESTSSSASPSTGSSSSGEYVYVEGYRRKNGTYVKGYWRRK
ncbi:hypothetical protein ACYULU_07980 [Breznakiellaceae bacterium SP9]